MLSGCVQATRHSNALVFGTNTSLGIKVGAEASQTPGILVGYSRQEAVVVPLVANVEDATGVGGDGTPLNRLKPCDLTRAVATSGAPFAVHPCSLVAVNGKAMDSYSVLASFGANFDLGTHDGTAKGGLAQYFATGMAAQLLATMGGASVVAVGSAATASALKTPDAEQAIEALYGDDASFKMGRTIVTPFEDFVTRLQALVTATDPLVLKSKVTTFETVAGSPVKIADKCTDAKACNALVRDSYSIGYFHNQNAFETALKGWTIP